MDHPLSSQIGGTHYKGMLIEPFTFGLANRYDAAIFSVMKYVSRHGLKGGADDLRKAKHILFIRTTELPESSRIVARDVISVSRFVEANKIAAREASILHDLHEWATERHPCVNREVAEDLAAQIDALIAESYPEEKG